MSSSKSNKDVIVNLSACKYESVQAAVKAMGWTISWAEDEATPASARASSGSTAPASTPTSVVSARGRVPSRSSWNLWWTDTSVSVERVIALQPWQCINHFPGMHALARKAWCARTLNTMAKIMPREFDFYPQSWSLPEEWPALLADARAHRKRTYVCKPDHSCQGKGIILTRKPSTLSIEGSAVVQRYIAKPLLIDGFKFDLRVYVLVTGIQPLRVLLFGDGLVRLCATPYSAPRSDNLENTTMHLTNYAVNKHNEGYIASTDSTGAGASKRTLVWWRSWLHAQGYDADEMWRSIGHLIVKTLIAGQPQLSHTYTSATRKVSSARRLTPRSNVAASTKHVRAVQNCFEILGVDILVDSKLRPWLIEINHSPSFTCDSPLDMAVKSRLLREVFQLLNLKSSDRKVSTAADSAAARSRLYSSKPRSALALAAHALNGRSSRPVRNARTPCSTDDDSDSDADRWAQGRAGSTNTARSNGSTSKAASAAELAAADPVPAPTSLKQLLCGCPVERHAAIKQRWFEAVSAPGFVRVFPPADELDARVAQASTARLREVALGAALGSGARRTGISAQISPASSAHSAVRESSVAVRSRFPDMNCTALSPPPSFANPANAARLYRAMASAAQDVFERRTGSMSDTRAIAAARREAISATLRSAAQSTGSAAASPRPGTAGSSMPSRAANSGTGSAHTARGSRSARSSCSAGSGGSDGSDTSGGSSSSSGGGRSTGSSARACTPTLSATPQGSTAAPLPIATTSSQTAAQRSEEEDAKAIRREILSRLTRPPSAAAAQSARKLSQGPGRSTGPVKAVAERPSLHLKMGQLGLALGTGGAGRQASTGSAASHASSSRGAVPSSLPTAARRSAASTQL